MNEEEIKESIEVVFLQFDKKLKSHGKMIKKTLRSIRFMIFKAKVIFYLKRLFWSCPTREQLNCMAYHKYMSEVNRD